MNKKITLFSLVAIFLFPEVFFAQKYWVKFTDKNGTPYSVSTPSAYLSSKAIQRRTNQGIAIDQTDLPVTPSYVSQVDAVSGVTVLYRSKWLNGIVITVSNTVALSSINSFSFVSSTGPVNRYKISMPFVDHQPETENAQAKNAATTNSYYGPGWWQSKMMGVDCLHYFDFKGQGMTIAVLDAGFFNVHTSSIYDSLFLQNRLLGTRDFVTGDTMVFEDNYHGAAVLSTMAAYKQGVMVGTAPKANYWLLRTEDVFSETISEEYNWIRGAEFADSVGADICTTSLGYTTFDGGLNNHSYSQLDGKTAPMSIASTMAARKGMIVVNAAGNEGCGSPGGCWYYVGVPADADSIISVGAVDSLKNKAGFSSFGPTSDGRIKPDLSARGLAAYVCNGGCFYGNGTSFAAPILSGGVACLWQCKKFATNFQIMNALKSAGSNSATPNNMVGWGVPDMCSLLTSTILTVTGENEIGPRFSVYPNPFTSELQIKLSKNMSDISLRIYDVLGKEVLSKYVKNETSSVYISDLKNFDSGVYFINISSGTYNSTQKIIRQ
jgi:hypothetical protein